MAITLSNKKYHVFGDVAAVIADVDFDSSYPYGGESFDSDQELGMHNVEMCIPEVKKGFSISYDYSNKKFKVFKNAPPIVYEEKHTPDSSGKITLNYPPAYIMAIYHEASPLKMTTTGATLAAGEAQPDAVFAAGTRATLTTYPGTNEITNGDIGDGTGWTAGDDWSIGTGVATKASSTKTATLAHNTFAATVGHTYRTVYTISGYASGALTIGLGGASGTARTADGTYTEDITATTVGGLAFTPSGTSAMSINNVYIYDLCDTVYVTYITQAWKDVWDNLVQEETQTTTTHAATLTNIPIAIQAINATGTTSTNACLMLDKDDTPATGECKIAATTGVITFAADDAVTSCVVTYIKKPSSGFLYNRFVAEESISAASNVCTPTYPILIWGYSGQLPENTAVTEQFISLGGTAGTGEAKLDLMYPGTRITGQSVSTGTAMYVWGRPDEIETVPLEVKDGEDLSDLTSIRVIFLGA
jgi:hypothetical protein